MPIYNAPAKDLQFVMHDLLKVSEQDIPGYADLDRDFTGAVIEEAGKIATNVLVRCVKVAGRRLIVTRLTVAKVCRIS